MLINHKSRHSIVDTQYFAYLRERDSEDKGLRISMLAEIIKNHALS